MNVLRKSTWTRIAGLVLSLTATSATGVQAQAAGPDALQRRAVPATRQCGDLLGTDLVGIGGAGSHVTRASETIRGGVTFCSVEGALAPFIGFRVDLPTRTWTGRFLQIGCGGLCGQIRMEVGAAEGCRPLAEGGFVIASTDMGHQGMGGEFGRDPQKRADFAYRAVHLTSRTAKALIQDFYGVAPAFSYFSGCSDGGREALVEAQRFPDDFDGVIAGAPAMNFQVQNSLYHGWQARSNTGPDGKAILLADRLPILHRAVLEACDGLDGQVDGLISAPGLCRFDPASARCATGSAASEACLTPAEVDVARKLYDGPRDAATGERLTAGGPLPGSELAWAGVFVPRNADEPIFSAVIARDALRDLVFDDQPSSGTDLRDLTFDRETFDRLRPRHPLYDATDPDLSAFAARGGKLILWHGWADPHISPLNTVAYHDAVRTHLGESRAEAFERLYLLPGVHHCRGGEGPSAVDLLTPMLAWVEAGVAPDAVVAGPTSAGPSGFGQPGAGSPGALHGPEGGGERRPAPVEASSRTDRNRQAREVLAPPGTLRSRPVYPYPSVAMFDGKGDPNAASSYRRGGEPQRIEVPAWAGNDFFAPYRGVAR